jgi:hypothetical protein
MRMPSRLEEMLRTITQEVSSWPKERLSINPNVSDLSGSSAGCIPVGNEDLETNGSKFVPSGRAATA